MREVFEDDYPVNDEEDYDTLDDVDKAIPNQRLSVRGQEWAAFAKEVLDHIETYTIHQYGDKGEDQCTEFTVQDFQTQIKKYTNRFGRNSRPGQDEIDLKKIAHYSQMLLFKLRHG